jgi:hypothetical protein
MEAKMIRRSRLPLLTGVAVAAILAVTLVFSGCCAEQTVKVKTGEEVLCTYGEVVSSNVKEIDVPASEAGKYTVTKTTITCPRHLELERLYAEAQAALAAGDVIGAKAKLAEIIAKEPTYRSAKRQADDIAAGRTPAPDTTPPPSAPVGSPTDTGTTGIPAAPVASLSKWVPDVIPGYAARVVVADASALTREYVPTAKGPVDVVVVVAEQKADDAAAKRAAGATIASSYGADRSTISVKGRILEFGTYSTGFAAVAWNEGGILVVAEAHVTDRKPADAKSALQAVAEAIIQ